MATFLKYFAKYILFSKTRQRLLFLAIVGLFLSSLSLLVLQSTMGGLQKNLKNRSKRVEGSSIFRLRDYDKEFIENIESDFKALGVPYTLELEIELLMKHRGQINPTIVHGIDYNRSVLPNFLKNKEKKGIIVGSDLANSLRADYYSDLGLISPTHTTMLLDDIPRVHSVVLSELFFSNVPEVDRYHSWTRVQVLQNLIRKRKYNTVRIYAPLTENWIAKFKEKDPGQVEYISWEEKNATLVWALNLETTVMISLFAAMSLLVALSISSGFMIFFGKVKLDLLSFWILGFSKQKILKLFKVFLHLLSITAVFLGMLGGVGLLQLMEQYGGNIMPDIFIERGIPVHYTLKGVLLSFLIPYSISIIFSYFALGQLKTQLSNESDSPEGNFLSLIRNVG